MPFGTPGCCPACRPGTHRSSSSRTLCSRVLHSGSISPSWNASVAPLENASYTSIRTKKQYEHHTTHPSSRCISPQGFEILKAASAAEHWNLPLSEIARVWRGGCIIRCAVLPIFQRAFVASQNADWLSPEVKLIRVLRPIGTLCHSCVRHVSYFF